MFCPTITPTITMYDPTTRTQGCCGTFCHILQLLINRIKQLWQACLYDTKRIRDNITQFNTQNFRCFTDRQMQAVCFVDVTNAVAKQHLTHVIKGCFLDKDTIRPTDQTTFNKICHELPIELFYDLRHENKILSDAFQQKLAGYKDDDLKSRPHILGMFPIEISKEIISKWNLKELTELREHTNPLPFCGEINKYATQCIQNSLRNKENVKWALDRFLAFDDLFTTLSSENAKTFVAQLDTQQRLEFFSRQITHKENTTLREELVSALSHELQSTEKLASELFDRMQKERQRSLKENFFDIHLTYSQFSKIAPYFSPQQLHELAISGGYQGLYLSHWVFTYVGANPQKMTEYLDKELSGIERFDQLIGWDEKLHFDQSYPESQDMQAQVKQGKNLFIERIAARAKEMAMAGKGYFNVRRLSNACKYKILSTCSSEELEKLSLNLTTLELTKLQPHVFSALNLYEETRVRHLEEILKMTSPDQDCIRVARAMFTPIQHEKDLFKYHRYLCNVDNLPDMQTRWKKVQEGMATFPSHNALGT